MKVFFTLIASLILSSSVWACSWESKSFCTVISYTGYNILYGRVVEHNPNSIRFEIINVLRGQETRDTVTVWDNVTWCTDTIRLRSRYIGQVGDSAIISFPIIDSINNTWDVIGDYYFSDRLDETYCLGIKNDTVRGLIKVEGFFPPNQVELWQIGLSELLNAITNKGNCDDLRVSIKEISALANVSLFPNPTTDFFKISGLPKDGGIELYAADGRLVSAFNEVSDQFSVSNLPAGTYTVKISAAGETGFRRIVKL